MSSVDKLAKELKSLINESDDRKPKAYDTDAQVVRIEDDILWVHIPGGVEETPVKKTINALPGDTVKVHIENGGAWVSGNSSAPPTDDRQANIATDIARTADIKAEEAVNNAERARIAADAAEYEAGRAKEIAESVEGIAQEAKTDAGIAKTAANESLKGLSMTQDVLDVVNWVATHGVYIKAETYVEGTSYYTITATEVTDPSQKTDELVGRYYEKDGDIYVKTEDTEYDDSKTYYIVTGTPVPTPKAEDIGQYYTLNVKDAMGDYINAHLALTNEGLYVMADHSEWKVKIADDGVYILDPNNKSANTMNKDGSVIGYEGETRVEIDYHSLRLIDKEGDPYVYFSDLRNSEGVYEGTTEYEIKDNTDIGELVFIFDVPVSEIVSVTCNGVALSYEPLLPETVTIDTSSLSIGDIIIIVFKSTDRLLKAFTFGQRRDGEPVGLHSFAFGEEVTASGYFSHAEGSETTASGGYSHAEGYSTKANGDASHAEGLATTASGRYSHAEGARTKASGGYAHAEGTQTTASGNVSHAEGLSTTASGDDSHAEGSWTNANGNASHAEGASTTASSYASHAEGSRTNASGYHAHAEGQDSTASGYSSHAEGQDSTASGLASHAQNYHTIAEYMYQTAIGKYNDNKRTSAFEIGNGESDSARSNALEVGWDGTVTAYPTDSTDRGFEVYQEDSSVGAVIYYTKSNGIKGWGGLSPGNNFGLYWYPDGSNGTWVINGRASGGVFIKNDANIRVDNTQSLSFTSQYVTKIVAERWGKVVTIILNNMKSVPSKQTITLFTLPAGWRPSATVMELLRNPTDSTRMRVSIDSNGNVNVYNYESSTSAASTNASCTITYVAT